MRRIYPDHAYGPAPRAGCYWPTTTEGVEVSQARGEITADVAVIGAGFTGLSTALHLARAGADVVVLEAEYPGWGASGRNGGFCCLGGSAASGDALTRMFGEPARREWCQTELAAVDLARGLMAKHGIDADQHSNGETLMAHTRAAADNLEMRAARVEADYGVRPVITPEEELAQNGMKGPFLAAMTTPIGVAVNPYKYVTGLARAAIGAGVRVFGQSPVRRIDAGYELRTDHATIRAGRLVVATNGYSSDDLPDWMRARFLPTQSNVIVTRELSTDELAAQGWTTNQMCYDDRFFLHYFRLMPNNRMLFGMRAGLRCSPQARCQDAAGDQGAFRPDVPGLAACRGRVLLERTAQHRPRPYAVYGADPGHAGGVHVDELSRQRGGDGQLCRRASGRPGAGPARAAPASRDHETPTRAYAPGPVPA